MVTVFQFISPGFTEDSRAPQAIKFYFGRIVVQHWYRTVTTVLNQHHNEQAMRKCVLCHMRITKAQISSLISAYVVRCLDSIIPILAKFRISMFCLVSVAGQVGSSLTWSQIPEDTFSRDVAHYKESF